MSKPLVLFDYDGVLINTFLPAWQSNHDIGLEVTQDEYRQWFTGNVYEAVEKKHGHNKLQVAMRYIKAFHTRTHRLAVHPAMEHLVRGLSKEYMLCIVSSGSEPVIKKQLLNSHLLDCFADIFGYETDVSKVKKIKDALRMYGVGREKCVFVTDTLGDIKEAKEVGIHTIAVTWGFHDEEMLHSGNPESLVRTPQELQRRIESLF